VRSEIRINNNKNNIKMGLMEVNYDGVNWIHFVQVGILVSDFP